MHSEISQGLLKGGVGSISFLTLVDALQINDILYQLLLSLMIILIQSLVIPLIKYGINQLKEKIKQSKIEGKEDIITIIDKTTEDVVGSIQEVADNIKSTKENKESE